MEKVIFQTYSHWYERMQLFIKENEKVKNCDICFLGDSIVEMAPVNKLIKNNEVIINRGIISDKTQGVLMSLDDRVIAINPKKIVLFIGSNDICDGYLLETIVANYIKIINRLQEKLPDVKLIVSTITPPCYYVDAPVVDHIYPDCRSIDKIIALNTMIKEFDKKFKNVVVFDAFSIIKDQNNSLAVEDTVDGIHLNKHGYQKIGQVLSKLL